MPITVHVSIENSDDKLPQSEWANFVAVTGEAIDRYSQVVHGSWFSSPSSRYQNAIWGFEIDVRTADVLKVRLEMIKGMFNQDSIAWTVGETVFV